MIGSPRTGRRTSRTLSTLALLASFGVAACSADKAPAGPSFPDDPPPPRPYRTASFIIDVSTSKRTITVTKPQTGRVDGPALGRSGDSNAPSFSRAGRGGGPDFSLVGGDVIDLTTSNFAAGLLGAQTPGKIRITFDVSITNKLNGVSLVTPTWPTPPAAQSGVFMFPYSIDVTATAGGVSVGGQGNTIIVEAPRYGLVDASVDWNGDGAAGSGTPHNFFNDAGCAVGASDCFRYETFPVVESGSTTGSRGVGFDIDPTVGDFRVFVVVAADLANSGPPPVGTIAGVVTSPERGVLSGVNLAVSGGFSGVTDAAGAYSIASVNTGPRTVSIASGLPAGCTAPAPQGVTVAASTTSTVNFSVTCSVPAGTITGTIRRSFDAAPLTGVSVVIDPTAPALAPYAAIVTNASGVYSRSVQVPVGGSGAGTITLGNIPASCTNPGPLSYSGLAENATQTLDITLTCVQPPAQYQYTQVWSGTGATRTLTVTFDPSTRNDPAINGTGADDIASVAGRLNWDAARLTFASVSANNGFGVIPNSGTPGQLTFVSQNAAGSTTAAQVLVITFNVVSGATGSVTTTTTLTEVLSGNGDNLLPFTAISEATLTLP